MRYMLLMPLMFAAFQLKDTAPIKIDAVIGPPTLVEYMDRIGYLPADTFVVTAYLPIDEFEGRYHGITYSGAPAVPYHTLAVDPQVLPLGIRLYIEGLGWWTTEDTGNLIKGNRLDICVNTREEAMLWGLRERRVWLPETLESIDMVGPIQPIQENLELVFAEVSQPD